MIEAVSRTCKTMADGTLRITVDIEPNQATAAFSLFGAPDVPVVLARLTQAAAQASAQAETIAADKPKGGPLAKLAGQWCNDPKFWAWIVAEGEYWVPDGEKSAAEILRGICGIESRAELDHNSLAARLFNEKIRAPYMEYLRQSASL